MANKTVLTFNAGSSTVKIGIFKLDRGQPIGIGKAAIDFASRPSKLHFKEASTLFELPLKVSAGDNLSDIVEEVWRELGTHFDVASVTAVGHRTEPRRVCRSPPLGLRPPGGLVRAPQVADFYAAA